MPISLRLISPKATAGSLDYSESLSPITCSPMFVIQRWPGGKASAEWQSKYIYTSSSILSRFIENDAFRQLLDCIPMPHDALLSELMK